MPSTYSNLKIELMATGEKNTTWGTITNTNLGTALEEAIVGSADVTFASGDVTLTLTDTNATQAARNVRLRCTGTTGGVTRNLVVPSIEKPYIVRNDCADSIVVKTAAGTGITVPAGKTMWVYTDATNVVDAVTHLSSLTLGTALPVAQGGTGATAAPAARTNLGATTIGSNLFTLTNPSAITFPRFNADNTVTARAAVDFRTDIGATTVGGNLFTLADPSAITFLRINADNTASALNAADFRTAIGAGVGTVTSVDGTGTVNGITLTGTVTSSGSLTLGGTLSGVSLTTQVTDTLPVANGGTGTATAFTLGSVVFAGASGTYSQDNGNFFWDDTNKRLGVGTPSPNVSLDVIGGIRARGGAPGGGGASNNGYAFNGTGDTDSGMFSSADGQLEFYTNNSERLRINSTGGITSSDLADAAGYKGLPQNSQTAGYTLVLADQGKHISITTGGVIIPANGATAFPIGTTIVVYNDSASTQTIAITTDTLRLAGTATTGTRTLAQRGLCTLVKVKATEWVATGNVT
jgi:hypothetical protein